MVPGTSEKERGLRGKGSGNKRSTRRTDHDLLTDDPDDLDPNLPIRDAAQDLLCIVQIRYRKHALGHGDCTAPTQQHELHQIRYRNLSALPGRYTS